MDPSDKIVVEPHKNTLSRDSLMAVICIPTQSTFRKEDNIDAL